ncbi:DNA repair protein RecO [Thermithiobacillus plumbiphilus]|uniref:DNA repair protein RecO n=1 Tax=Thermithiobacillus plumbiphilus TaxID=1729899 RepID=A0ABU9DBL3_9PROT
MSTPAAVEAYVLHRYPYQESSLVVELFTLAEGRVGAVARGARRPKSQFARLQPWQPYLVSWRGRGDLATLTGAEDSGPLAQFKGIAVACGFYLNELLIRLLQRWDPHPGLYAAYQGALAALAAGEAPDWVLRRFEFRLLQEIGFGFDLSGCIQCGRPLLADASPWLYLPEQGLICAEHGGEGQPTCRGSALRALEGGAEMPPASDKRVIRQWLQGALATQLGGKPLQSQALLQVYRRPGRLSGGGQENVLGEDSDD